jgi:phospholipid/cholesterol/gamma-HCH transport system substrate-binding protein
MRLVRARSRKRSDLEARYWRAAVIAALSLALGTVFVFARQSLFGGGYQINAVFSSVNQLRTGSEVRIAGIKVGELDAVAAGPRNTSVVQMGIDSAGLPIHTDATLTVRPRLLLEGNAYIDLNPGSPGAPDVVAGSTIPLSHTAVSVQLDQVVGVFDAPTRGALQSSIAGLASGLGGARPGYGGLRYAVRELNGSLLSITQVAHATGGTQPGDLGRAVGSSSLLTTALAANPQALAASVTGFDRVMGALATENRPLAESISGFDRLLQIAPPSLTEIDAALPPLTRFANALRPALQAAPATLQKTNLLLDQVGGLVQPAELPRLVSELVPVTANLPQLEGRLQTLFSYTTPVTSCISTHVVPVLDSKIQDGANNTTGDPAWLDLLHGITGFTSASTSFDGNAGTFRAGLAFGATALQGIIPGLGTVVGKLDPNVEGVRPIWLGYGVEPAYRPDQPCASQPLPNLNAQSGPAPAWDLHPATAASQSRSR